MPMPTSVTAQGNADTMLIRSIGINELKKPRSALRINQRAEKRIRETPSFLSSFAI
jgi:hypothetical protein